MTKETKFLGGRVDLKSYGSVEVGPVVTVDRVSKYPASIYDKAGEKELAARYDARLSVIEADFAAAKFGPKTFAAIVFSLGCEYQSERLKLYSQAPDAFWPRPEK